MKPRYIALLLLAGCHSAQEPTIRLPVTAIWSADSVEKAMGPGRRQAAASAYYRLGDSLLEKGYCDTAVRAFQIAERLGFQPRADLMYRLSAGYAGKSKYDSDANYDIVRAATRYAELAIQMGYGHPENFRNDPRFAGLKENGYFIRSYTEALGGTARTASPEKTLWESFVSEFAAMSIPLTIDQDWIKTHPIRREISLVNERFVPEYRTIRFSRMVPYQYYYVGLVKKAPAYTALLYAGKSLYLMRDEEDTRATFLMLVTYDNSGQIIDKMLVAGQRDLSEPSRILTLQPDMSFVIKNFRNIYAHDPEKAGYENNAITRVEAAGELSYRITATGKFEKLQAPLAFRLDPPAGRRATREL